MEKTRRHFTPEQKDAILREHLIDRRRGSAVYAASVPIVGGAAPSASLKALRVALRGQEKNAPGGVPQGKPARRTRERGCGSKKGRFHQV